MIKLLTVKEKAKNIYAEHEMILKPVLKFLFSFVALVLLKAYIGYSPLLNMWPVILLISVAMAFIPSSLDVVIFLGIMIVDLYTLSMELAIVLFLILLIMLLFFFRFTPQQGVFLVLIPFAFFLKIPYIIPLAAGLVCTPVAIVSVTFGTIVYYILNVVSANENVINNLSNNSGAQTPNDKMTAVSSIMNILTSNPEMYLTMIAFAITIAVVYGIKRRSINHAWEIAVVVGAMLDLIITMVGSLLLGIKFSILMLVISSVISFILAYLLQALVFSVDYSRTENTQFEDDEYYYYVKAVPKINVTAPEMNVKRINAQRRKKVAVTRRK